MRAPIAILAAVAVTLTALPWVVDLPTKLIWNASPSVPVGLYWLRPSSDLRLGDLVIVTAPPALADLLSQRGYLPDGLPLLKRVVAVPGQTVCRDDLTITVGGVVVGQALRADRQGRAMPVWQGCWAVAPSDVFLMNSDVLNSLDGRYFGPITRRFILGIAIPIWTSDAVAGGPSVAEPPFEDPPNSSFPNRSKGARPWPISDSSPARRMALRAVSRPSVLTTRSG